MKTMHFLVSELMALVELIKLYDVDTCERVKLVWTDDNVRRWRHDNEIREWNECHNNFDIQSYVYTTKEEDE